MMVMLGFCQQRCFRQTSRSLASLFIATFSHHVSELQEFRIRHFCATLRAASVKSSDQILFLGSDSFSVRSLEVLLKLYSLQNITVVVSNERNTVGKYSTKNQLKIINWEEFKSTTRVKNSSTNSSKFDIGIVSSFGFLIPKYIIESCRMGILNVHASLLPRWRGAAPIAHAIMNGDEETGITIMKIAPHKFDVGPILHTKRAAIPEHMKATDLTLLLARLGAEALEEVLCDLPSYVMNAKSQSLEEGTPAPRLNSEIGHVSWDSQTPVQIYNLFRAIFGSHKLRSSYQGKLVDFDEVCLASKISDSSTGSEASTTNVENFPNSCDFLEGQILYWNKLLCVKCFNPDKSDKCIRNNWIFIRRIKIGKKWISAADFSNGFLSKSKGPHYFTTCSPESREINSISRSDSSLA